jgi:hypothetical protein
LLFFISGHLGLTLFDRTGPDLMTSTDLFGTGLDLLALALFSVLLPGAVYV